MSHIYDGPIRRVHHGCDAECHCQGTIQLFRRGSMDGREFSRARAEDFWLEHEQDAYFRRRRCLVWAYLHTHLDSVMGRRQSVIPGS